MSASVIKIRAGHASTGRIDVVRDMYRELERLGLAEHAGSGRRPTSRWRLYKAALTVEALDGLVQKALAS